MKNLIKILFLTLIGFSSFAQDVKISNMTAATDLTGTVYVPIIQNGVNKKAAGSLFGAATTLNQGTTYTQVGTVLDELFPGSSLNATNWSGALPTGASISSKLIIASGANDWSRYLQMQKFANFEKETFEIYFKAVTKNSGDAWGLHQNLSLLASNNASIYIKFDQSNGANSGMLSIGSTVAANEYGYSQSLTWSAGDQLKLTIQKKPGKSITILENITSPSNPKAYGDFPIDIKTNGGQFRLTFLGGQQEFSEFKLTNNCRNFGGTFGVVFLGDSQTNGAGNTDKNFRWCDVLMKNQTDLYEVIGINTWMTTDFTVGSRVTEFLSGISAKYLVVNTGYNDWQFTNVPATYQAALQSLITTAQGLGYTVICVSIVPSFTLDNTTYDAPMSAAATATGAQFISIRTAMSIAGVKLNPNYISPLDIFHLNDDGGIAMANSIIGSASQLYSQLFIDYSKKDVIATSLPVTVSTTSLVGVDNNGVVGRVDPSLYLNRTWALLTPGTFRAQQTGNLGITGKFVYGGDLQQLNATAQGLQIGYNNGASDNNGTNINITNAGNGGTGFPQKYNNITGLRNIDILALSATGGQLRKDGADHNISGNDNILIQSNLGNNAITLSGSNNTVIGSTRIGTFTSANNNIGIGFNVFSGITTGSFNIWFSNTTDVTFSNQVQTSGTIGTILIGSPWDAGTGAQILTNNEVVINSYATTGVQKKFTFGPLGARASSVVWKAGYQGGTDVTGFTHFIDAPYGTGAGLAGDIRIRHSIAGSTGTTVHSTFTESVIFNKSFTTFGVIATSPNFANNLSSTATAAGTTTLTIASNWFQTFTGGTTQTVVLPVASTVTAGSGLGFRIVNISSGVVTLNTSGANTVKAMAAGSYLDIWCVNPSGGTGTASWNWIYTASINN